MPRSPDTHSLDVVIRGATIAPGDGEPRRADVGILGDRIVAIEPDLDASAAQIIDGKGLLLCPGFIDMHAHTALQTFTDPCLDAKVAQGFTTELINPDGLAPAPVASDGRERRQAYMRALEGNGPDRWTWSTFGDYLDQLSATKPATTLVPSAGHNAIRDLVLGSGRTQPDQEQLAAMCREVRACFEQGARALSFGLIYQPGVYAETNELVELAKEAARVGAPLVPHVRNEGAGIINAIAEMIDVARRSGAPLHISHLKVVGNPHLADPLLEMLHKASDDIDLTCDQYPYGAGSTILVAILPAWAQEGGATATLARISDPEERAAIHKDIHGGLPGWENLYAACGPENIFVANAGGDRASDVGKSLATIADERSIDPLDAALELLLECALDVTMIDHYASEATVRKIFVESGSLVGSDGIFGAKPHPRLFGSAARVLGRYALKEKIIPLTEAVARLTSRPADRLGLADRGRIAVGKRADLVLLHPDEFIDLATYDEPTQHPGGVALVMIAGEEVWTPNGHTGRLPGGVSRTALDGV